ncbi:30S ribosomal protein S16 [Candidatus Neptunochlamydia vexilliferae]|uniref:Small ribosomal subunit protein bS16 n=1 Tax=Candidatus Neptunichlamydia vexilliferae TaxID=1651774 RepID=A0ABS0AZW9_9BACT|nr:30S ribosomal protein S16 [Candidatus Neptunochlamydia vexilliferae]MBF5059499.1 30S ribosomal protein S16 [Candidatus Neptunochlamydia vexilliferae]
MGLKIRLRQQGRTNRLTYRLVVTDSRSPRDGKYVENLGHYDPHVEGNGDSAVNEERLQHWVDLGAELSEKARAIVARKAPGVMKSIRERALAKVKKRSEKRKVKKK